jgi:hypothetical protein
MMGDKFWPRSIEEVEDKPSLINEPLSASDGTTALPVINREWPLHAVLCESLKQAKELLARLEARGVYVPRAEQRKLSGSCTSPRGIRCGRWRRAWNWKGWSEANSPLGFAGCGLLSAC